MYQEIVIVQYQFRPLLPSQIHVN